MRAVLGALLLISGCVRPTASFRASPTDRLDVRELLDRVSDAVNHEEWDTVADLCTDDVVWRRTTAPSWEMRGQREVRAFLQRNAPTVEVLSFLVAASRIEFLSADEVKARSTMSELLRFRAEDMLVQVVGTYEDTLVRRNGAWRIAERTITTRFERRIGGGGDARIEAIRPLRP